MSRASALAFSNVEREMKTTPRTEADAVRVSRRALLSAGMHDARISEAIEKESKAGNDMIVLTVVVRDAAGDLYGTTLFWGAGYGVVFKLTPDGREHVLHSFTGGDDGAYPWCTLLKVGNRLIGTSSGGGAEDDGTLFKLRE